MDRREPSRLTVKEASELLGISEHAIRQRIRRNTLDSDKDADGRVYVLLDVDTEISGERSGKVSGEQSIVDSVQLLLDQNQLLREQLDEAHAANRENRRIIAALTQRIPELEAPPEPRESPVTSTEDTGSRRRPTEPQEPLSEEPLEQRSWWRRWFGGA